MENSNEQIFELMTKMYSEMQDNNTKIYGEIKNIKTELQDVKTELQDVKTEVKKTNMTIENDIKPRIEALFDGYKQNSEAINRIEDDINVLRLSINELNIKTIKNDSNIISFNRRLSKFHSNNH